MANLSGKVIKGIRIVEGSGGGASLEKIRLAEPAPFDIQMPNDATVLINEIVTDFFLIPAIPEGKIITIALNSTKAENVSVEAPGEFINSNNPFVLKPGDVVVFQHVENGIYIVLSYFNFV
ncbi:MAG: hypothetical protein K0B10_07120 [Vicingaceae bacterium]|nr:hypothetical protein [Vicingaceae bacterium]